MTTFNKSYSGSAVTFDALTDTFIQGATNSTLASHLGQSYALTDIFIISGTSLDDTIVTLDGADNVTGGDGYDTITTGGGADTISDTTGTKSTIDAGSGDDQITIGATFGAGSSIAGGTGIDTLNLNGAADLSLLSLTGIEILQSNGFNVKAKASEFDAFDTIRYNTSNSGLQVSLTIIASGTATALDLSDELGNGGGPRAVLLTGSTDDETITVGMLGDTVNAGAGADTIYGGQGSDTLNGDAGNDTLYGESGNDTLGGGANDDTLIGGDGDDTLDGGAENDILLGGDGNDTITDTAGTVVAMNGGAGDDALRIGSSITSGSIDGGTGVDVLELWSGTPDLSKLGLQDIQILNTWANSAKAFASQLEAFDVIRYNGTNTTNTISITLVAAGGATTLDLSDELTTGGGPRAVTITGSTDNETIVAGLLADTVNGDAGNDTIHGGAGSDTLNGNAGADTIYGGDGDDTIDGGSENDTLSGDAGNDIITDTTGTVAGISGGTGDDTLRIGSTFTSGSIGGGIGTDTLELWSGSQDLSKLDLSDTEYLSTWGQQTKARADQFEAFDVIQYNDASSGSQVSMLLVANGSATTLDLVDELTAGGGPRSVLLTGSTDSETITVGIGSDTVNAAGGADTLYGGQGSDTLNGEAGADTLHGQDGNDALNGGADNDTVYGGTGDDVIDGGSEDDVLAGDDGRDVITDTVGAVVAITGGADDDVLRVGSSFTSGTIDGGGGIDTLELWSGAQDLSKLNLSGSEILHTWGQQAKARADQFETFDVIRYSDSAVSNQVSLLLVAKGGATTLDLSDELSAGGGPRAVNLTGSSDDETLTTGIGADTINAGGGADTIDGGLSSDVLNGQAGNDTIISSAGIDTIDGGSDADTAIINRSYSTYGLTLNLASTTSTTTLSGDGTTIINVETIKITGGSGDDTFTAHDGADSLDGGDGNDTLAGNGGADIIIGGTGTDTAAFRGAYSTYSLQRVDAAGTTWIVIDKDTVANGNDGTDTLTGIETLGFAAGSPATVSVQDLIGALSDSDGTANAVAEDANTGTSVGITALAVDGSSQSITYTLTADAGGRFSVDSASGLVTVAAPLDFESATSHNITVRATSTDGSFTEKSFTIAVGDVDEFDVTTPVDLDAALDVIDENATGLVGLTASSSDADGSTNVITYSLVTDLSGTTPYVGSFSIGTASGVVTLDSALNFETMGATITLYVKATSADGSSAVDDFAITLNDVNETPTAIGLSATAIDENNIAGSTVATLSVTDPDLGVSGNADPFTYALVTGAGDTDNGAFTISGSELKINDAANYEAKSSYSIRLRVTDAGTPGLSYETIKTISVNDKNETPTGIALSSSSIAEGNVAGAVVATLSATDPDLGGSGNAQPFTYEFATGVGDADNAAFTISGSDLKINEITDYEAKSNYSIRLKVTDSGGLTQEVAKTITVIDANEAPTALSLSATNFDEGNAAGAIIASLSVSDPDLSGSGNAAPFIYALVAGTGDTDNAAFAISGSDLKIISTADYETKSNYSIRLRVTDAGTPGLSFETVQVITVNDIVENAPATIALKNTTASVTENTSTSNRIKVADIEVTDDGLGSNVLGLTGADASRFEIDGGALYLRAGTVLDHEQKASLQVAVTVDDTEFPSNPDNVTGTYTLTVANVDPEIVTGTPGDDIIVGGIGVDQFSGLSGNDTLDGGGGADTLTGGKGDDVYFVDVLGDRIVELANEGTDTIKSTITVTLAANVENLVLLGSGPIGGTGNALANVIIGNVGDNTLSGGIGIDTVSYETASGGVTVTLATTAAQATGGAGTDRLSTFENLTGSEHADVLTGSTAANVLKGLGGVDALSGGSGNDTLDGGTGADQMMGGLGDDTYVIDDAGDTVTELTAQGIDKIKTYVTRSLGTGTNIENLELLGVAVGGTGNELANIIIGNAIANFLSGEGGNDTLDGGAGADTMSGGSGNDTYVVDNGGDVVDEQGTDTADKVRSAVTIATLAANVELLELTGSVSIDGTGNTLANTITGNSAANTLSGGAGDGQADKLIGGLGDDTYLIEAGDTVVEVAGGGIDTVKSAGTAILAAEVEKLILIGTDNVNGTGNALANIIIGNGGGNIIDGGLGTDTVSYETASAGVTVSLMITAGQDTVGAGTDKLISIENLTGSSQIDKLTGNGLANIIDGRGGADEMSGLLGNDIYVIDDVGDTVKELAGQGTDTVQSYVSFDLANAVNVETLTLLGTSNITGKGNDLANTITGNSGNNLLDGGIDALATTVDTLKGGLGDDTYVVRNANDKIVELAGQGTDTVQSFITYLLGTDVENLELLGSDKINATGNVKANSLIGNGGNNTLNGGLGNDQLTGGDGADTFFFNTALSSGTTTNLDTIGDFLSGTDTIQLENAIFAKLTVTGALTSDFFRLGTTAADANDYVIYDSTTGALYYDKDGNGVSAQVQFATLNTAPGLTASDFVVV